MTDQNGDNDLTAEACGWEQIPRLWVITQDVLGMGVPPSIFAANAKGGTPFRIYDDDGILYYRGRFYGNISLLGHSPMNWARNYAGATEIRYRDYDSGKWKTL